MKHETRVIGVLDPEFPAALHELARMPDALHVRGRLPRVCGVAIVGTRTPTEEALAYAHDLAAELAGAGLAIWSGGAAGIDRAAHEGALSVGGITIVVPGGGLRHPYPPGAEGLWTRVIEGGGAVVAIVPDGVRPHRWIFLARNGVIAACTRATIIVECGGKSGARSTAAHARRLGRPVLVAPQAPWSPAFDGFAGEARLGARPLLATSDVLALVRRELPADLPIELDDSARRVLAFLDAPRHPDEICDALDLPFAHVQAALASLRLAGAVEATASGTFVARNQRISS